MSKQVPKKYHCGYHAKRCKINDTQGKTELAYKKTWAEENQRRGCVNFGCTTLEVLLNGSITDQATWENPTERDYKVAATVIQWLGTNRGRYFLDEVQRRIKQSTKKGG